MLKKVKNYFVEHPEEIALAMISGIAGGCALAALMYRYDSERLQQAMHVNLEEAIRLGYEMGIEGHNIPVLGKF